MNKILKNKGNLLILLYIAAWSFLPFLIRSSIPMDTVEAIAWGHEWQMGYNKHPPMSAFFAELFFVCFGEFGVYFLSVVCVLISLFFIKKTSEILSDKSNKIPYYIFLSLPIFTIYAVEFNVNIMLLPFISICSYLTLRISKKNLFLDWTLLAIFSSCCILSKYTGLVFVGVFYLYLFFSNKGFKNWKLYASVLSFVLLLLPHAIWLFKNDFIIIKYAMGRSLHEKSTFSLMKILHLFIGQVSMIFPLFFFIKDLKFDKKLLKNRFVLCLCVFPVCIFLAYPLISQNEIKTMWTIICYPFVGFLFYEKKPVLKKVVYLNIIYALIYSGVTMFRPILRSDFDAKLFAKTINSKIGENKDFYVVGEIWLGSLLNTYEKSRPSFFINADEKENAWLDDAKKSKLTEKTLVLVSDHENGIRKYIQNIAKYKNTKNIKINEYNYCEEQKNSLKFKLKKCKQQEIFYVIL